MKAWHFLQENRRTQFSNELVEVGTVLRCDGEPILCYQGLHASKHPFDALKYAPGPILCRVKMGGKITKGGDKLVATERTVMQWADATEMLRKFARTCALDVVHLWDYPAVVLHYLKTGDESIREVAKEAAWATKENAADSAAWASADSAAWASADNAAWAAARAAAGVAKRAAAGVAKRDAAKKKQRKRFARMCNELLRSE